LGYQQAEEYGAKSGYDAKSGYYVGPARAATPIYTFVAYERSK
jgi:hypothetical protein